MAGDKKPSLFDVLENVKNTKDRSKINDPDYFKQLNPYMINRSLMQDVRTILVANMANINVLIDKDFYHDYMISALPRSGRVKWKKADEKSEFIEPIMQYYSVNENVAIQYLRLLTSEQCIDIVKQLDTGGVVGKKK